MSTILDDLKLQFKSGDVTTKLIFWNIGLFVVPYVLMGILSLLSIQFPFIEYVSLSSDPANLLWKPWSIITYAFFHEGFLHILFNMLMLHFSGRIFITFFTGKQLLSLYLLGSIFAGAIYILCYAIFPSLILITTSLIGASGAVMAILFATASYAPNMQLRLFIFGNVKLWHIALVLIIVDLIQMPQSNTGGHLAHLGGAFFGYIYIRQLKSGNDIGKWLSNLIDSVSGQKKQHKFKKVHRNYAPRQTSTNSKIITKDKSQQQLDDILDKISRSGYDSLTKDEKEFLFKAGK